MFMKQWEEKTTKLSFFSMQFVRNNEEIHLSFKKNEKQRTQALKIALKNMVANLMVSAKLATLGPFKKVF